MKINNELQLNDNGTVGVEVSYSRLDNDLDKEAKKKFSKDMDEFLVNLFSILEVGRNTKRVVNPDLDYVVKFTPELLKKMEEHDMQFLKDKVTGDLLPDLYDYTAKSIGGKVRLEIKGKPTGQDLANLSHSINNLIEQQRYDTLITEVHQLHIIAKHIERGQDNDRFAKVNAGRKHLLDAMRYIGPEEEKNKMIFDALSLLREGRELIEKTLLEKMDTLEMIPENAFIRLWKCFMDSTYFQVNVDRYDDIQEYFQYYYMCIQPMAYAYTVLGQPQLVTSLISESKKVFEHNKIDCLSTVEYLLPDRAFNNMWYDSPEMYEQKFIDAYKDLNEDEDLYITVKGSKILEVIGDDE